MPKLELTTRTKLAAGVFALSVVIGVVVLSSVDYEETAKAALEDAGVSRTNGEHRVTDLLTGEVEPGAEATTGVTLPLGWRVDDVMPAGPFEVLKQSHEDRPDGTWYEVTVRNAGPVPARFVAWVQFVEPAPVEPVSIDDGGVP